MRSTYQNVTREATCMAKWADIRNLHANLGHRGRSSSEPFRSGPSVALQVSPKPRPTDVCPSMPVFTQAAKVQSFRQLADSCGVVPGWTLRAGGLCRAIVLDG